MESNTGGVASGSSSVEEMPQMPAALERAFGLQEEGKSEEAIDELETALAEAHESLGALTFQDRITIALVLADFYQEAGTLGKALDMLAVEVANAETHYQEVKQSGTREEKREAVDGLTVIRDQRTQMALIGQAAPEISIKDWINSEPLSLESYRGNVVLLEFWATWCKPCHAMFPKIKKLYSDYADRGLKVIALTRYYFSFKSTAGTEANELELIQNFVRDHELQFPVGIAEDARTQMLYGAVGLPTFVLIDRRGAVRLYGRMGGDGTDPKFEEALMQCIDESANGD
jgi:thiol-disulfide isomerase/thioredoxin